MAKDLAYHKAVVHYNEELAAAAEKLAEEIEHETVKKWCVSVGKQHRAHAKRHQKAIDRLTAEHHEAIGLTTDVVDEQELPAEVEQMVEALADVQA